MRYYYEVSKKTFAVYGQVYKCNHPMYNKCTLYKDEDHGMAVIQQRFNKDLKHTWRSSIDIELVDDISPIVWYNVHTTTKGEKTYGP